jgi:hypothetical protein
MYIFNIRGIVIIDLGSAVVACRTATLGTFEFLVMRVRISPPLARWSGASESRACATDPGWVSETAALIYAPKHRSTTATWDRTTCIREIMMVDYPTGILSTSYQSLIEPEFEIPAVRPRGHNSTN